MALQINDYNYNGFQLNSVYCKIGHIQGNKNNINFNLVFYANKDLADMDTRNEHFIKLINYYFAPDLNSNDNFIAQAYNYLKTLPEYENSIDC